MSPPWRRAAPLLAPALAAALAAALVAGCGSQHGQTAPTVSTAPAPSLALSTATSGATWADLVLGGSAAGHNNFWQLFARPAGTTRWRLVTPPGMASNGGFALAGLAGRSFLAAFRPSQNMHYSPLVSSADNGAHWSTGQLAAGLAAVPDALASSPDGTALIALTAHGVQWSRDSGGKWTSLATRRFLAATAAGRTCGLTGLTAAALSPGSTPLAGGTCTRPGVTGIFAHSAGGWQAAGPTLPAALAGQPVTVLRLSTAAGREVTLLAAGSRNAATLLAGWASGAGRWVLSPGLATHGRTVRSVSFGPDGSVGLVLSGGRGATLTGPGGAWRWLGLLPASTQSLMPGPGAGVEALAAHQTTLTVWALGQGAAGWARNQVVNVPVPYGSSG
jgi:hypothetical protein